jgi:hypothetical protein
METPSISSLAPRIADLGFLLDRDIPRGGRDALLLVAMRPVPTLRHFDPELIEYWATDGEGRGRPADLTLMSPMPLQRGFNWGLIEIVDRLGVTNMFISFGGTLLADHVVEPSSPGEPAVIAAFTSPGPILASGGHSQPYDQFAAELGAFFARMMVPIDFEAGAEARISAAEPAARYAMFLRHETARLSASELVRDAYGADARLVRAEAARIAEHYPDAWQVGEALLADLGLAPGGVRWASRTSARG